MVTTENENKWVALVHELGPSFAERDAECDASGDFVTQNYKDLHEKKMFSIGVPTEHGGGGATHAQLCEVITALAHYSGSTALCYAMHTHPLATNVFKATHGMPGGEATCKKLAGKELIIAGTGANDWLGSSGSAERVEGGYKVNAHKRFCSGVPGAHIFATSIRFEGGENGPEVLHFVVPKTAEGFSVGDNWNTIGMRGTGSHDVFLKDVFVPDASIAARRPADEWHKIWSVVLPTALPLIMSAYVGIAERAAGLARAAAAKKMDDESAATLGLLENQLVIVHDCHDSMKRLNNNHGFKPSMDMVNEMLSRKTNIANAAMTTVELAAEVVGSGSFFRGNVMEQLIRDVRACTFHPLPEKKQVVLTGRHSMGANPITGEAVS